MNPRGAGAFRHGFPAPPRTVMLKPGAMARVWFARVVTLMFLLVGLVLVFGTLKRPLVLAFGSDGVGRIEQVKPAWRPHSHSRYFKLAFAYQIQGERQATGYGQVDASPPAVGQTLPIRVLRIGGIHLAEPRDPNMSGSGPCCVGLFVFAWFGFAALFAFAAWWGPVADRRLMRNGRAVAGTIVGKGRRSSGRSSRYQILYRFTTAEHGAQSAVQWVRANAYRSVCEGQRVTVIYDVLQPTRSTIYEASDYEVS